MTDPADHGADPVTSACVAALAALSDLAGEAALAVRAGSTPPHVVAKALCFAEKQRLVLTALRAKMGEP